MPIGAVTRLTGITSHTLRKWESRYHAIEPLRTDTGRRVYSQAQVDRLLLLRDLVRQGHQISTLARHDGCWIYASCSALAREPLSECELERALVVGVSLPTRLAEHVQRAESVEFVQADPASWLSGAEAERDSRTVRLMVELPTIPAELVATLQRACGASGCPRVVVVYGFANQKTLRTLMDSGVVCLKKLGHRQTELMRNLELAAEDMALVDLIDREALPAQTLTLPRALLNWRRSWSRSCSASARTTLRSWSWISAPLSATAWSAKTRIRPIGRCTRGCVFSRPMPGRCLRKRSPSSQSTRDWRWKSSDSGADRYSDDWSRENRQRKRRHCSRRLNRALTEVGIEHFDDDRDWDARVKAAGMAARSTQGALRSGQSAEGGQKEARPIRLRA